MPGSITQPALRFEGVSKNFRVPLRRRSFWETLRHKQEYEQKTALQKISFQIMVGEKLLLVGKNGAGKTTVLKLAAGFCEPTQGSVIRGEQCSHSRIGLMLSHQFLYPTLTGYQNLEFSLALYGENPKADQMDRAIADWGLSTFVDLPVGSYSNGQKSRLALGRATIHNPSLLLLDEPLVYLDDEGAALFSRFLEKTEQTVILTDQRELLADHVDRTIFL